MTRHDGFYQWTATVATALPHLSVPQARALALWSFGMVLARSCALTAVTAVLFGLAARLAFSSRMPGSVRRFARYATAGLLGLYVIHFSISALASRAIRHWHWLVLSVMLGLCIGTWAAASVAGRRGSRRREPLQR